MRTKEGFFLKSNGDLGSGKTWTLVLCPSSLRGVVDKSHSIAIESNGPLLDIGREASDGYMWQRDLKLSLKDEEYANHPCSGSPWK